MYSTSKIEQQGRNVKIAGIVVKNLNNMNKIGENRKMHYIFNYKRNLLQCNKPFFPLTDAETN